MKLPLAYYGDPILRQRAAEVESLTDDVLALIEDMKETHRALPASAGLAAPQVHHALRIFLVTPVVINKEGEYEYDEQNPEVYINPVLSNPSEERESLSQGCFSIPGVYASVERPCEIDVEAMNEKGETFKKRVVGPMAHAVMHENDHINGVLFIDRLDPKERKRLEASLQKVKKRYYLKQRKS